MNYILRRRKLGSTSCREIARLSQTGIQCVRNDAVLPEANIVFRWGCTSNVTATTIVNTAEAIHRVSDKRGFRLSLDEHELCPNTWGDVESFLEQAPSSGTTYPYIVRPSQHAQGKHVILCNTLDEVAIACSRFPSYYISEYVQKEAEYRVCVVQGRVAWVANKIPANPEDVAWNVALGGRFENVRWDAWPLKAVRIAVEAFNLSGLDFGGVDVMMRGNEAYVLEINSAPSLTSPYRQEATAKCFDWIVNNGKAHIPVRAERGGWRKFIHPSLSTEAWS